MPNDRRWKVNSQGYVLMDNDTPGPRRIYEHRYIWMQYYGPIPASSVISHKNGDTTDNRPENLVLYTRAHLAREIARTRRPKHLRCPNDYNRTFDNLSFIDRLKCTKIIKRKRMSNDYSGVKSSYIAIPKGQVDASTTVV